MKSGELEKLSIKTKDEIGFLAQSFYTIADKVIKEEAVIKNQLNRITFLNKYNENILSNLQAGVFVVDSDSKIEYCNNYIIHLLNAKKNELQNIHIYDLLKKYFITSGNIKRLKERNIKKYTQIPNIFFEQSKSERINFMLKVIPLWISRRKVKTLIVLEDITKTEQFWEKMVQAEKIASVGLLSAGMAHEINNPLGSILSHVQYLTAVESEPEKLDSLKWIADETRRIADLIERLLSFAREDSELMERASVNPAISEMLVFMKHDLKKRNINVVTELNKDLPPVLLKSNKLKQVLFNVILNASHAIDKNGTITINSDVNGNGGKSVIILVSDTGKGIPSEDFQRIFDPFFTTKMGERGTGLGLSICYSIITKAGGEIKVLNSSERGTTIRIQLKT
jgi:C4-dicarboxylate-specific signal transduction histidine kinase